MKHILYALVFCALTLSAHAATQLKIVATVNNDIITSRDLEGRVNMALQGANLPDDAVLRRQLEKQALESLIDEQIRLQEAERIGVMPTNEEIDEAFAKLAAQNNLPAAEFQKALERLPGVYPSLRRQIKTQLAWSNIVHRRVRPQVTITESDITNHLEERQKNPVSVEYRIAEIFLKNTEANRRIADQIQIEIREGKKRFSAVARQFSQGLEAGKGGSLGWVPENRFEPEFDATMRATPVGQISEVVETPRGLHILFVRDKRDVIPPKEGSQRLTLKQAVVPIPLSEEVPRELEARAQEQAAFFQSQARDCAAMDEVIGKINHPLSRDLGQVRLADLPPEVSGIVKDLPIGKASDPIRANDGFVVMMVCGREENTEDMVRDDIANALGIERLNRLQQRYYRDLRAAAYVDIRQ